MSKSLKVMTPLDQAKVGLFRCWRSFFSNIFSARDLGFQLFKRDFLASFKRSHIGFFWIIISPFVSALTWIFLNTVGIFDPGSTDVPYPVYVLMGTLFWQGFVKSFTLSTNTLKSGASFILQVSYPHEVLFFKQVAQFLTEFVASITMYLLLLPVFGIYPNLATLLLPFVCLPFFLLSSGFGLALSSVSALTMDLSKITDRVLSLSIWLTPVIYSNKDKTGIIQVINQYNPLTHLICSPRDIVLHGRLYDLEGFVYSSVFAVFVFLLSVRFFAVSEAKVVERKV